MDTILFITDLHAGSRIPALAGAQEAAAEHGWHVEEIEIARLTQPVAEVLAYWNPVGCILEGSSDALPEEDVFGALPIVHIDPSERMLKKRGIFVVENDNKAIAELAHRELCKTDCPNFAFIGWRLARWSRQREDRFAELLSRSGHDCHRLEDTWTLGNKIDFFARLKPFVQALPKPCGIFAANDDIAAAVIDACRSLDITVPGDVAIVGVDDDPAFCDNLHPTLSSVRPGFRNAGRLAVKTLAQRIANPDMAPAHVLYNPLGLTSRLSTRRLSVVGKRVADALDLIRREACSGLKAGDVVKTMGVTERLAETRFKNAVGHRITEEITDVRMERVLELLRDPKQDIGPIANLCGWDAETYLKRIFKRRFGMTMREWRAKNAKETS
jgi:LacI family transcriptional regulator